VLVLIPAVTVGAQQGAQGRGREAAPEAPGEERPAPAAAEVSVLRLVKFSGQLRDALDAPLAGTVGVTFALYADEEGGAPLWLETQNVTADADGRYSVLLGAESAEGLPLEIFSSTEARWLGVTVEGEAEQPRILLVSVPYALKAADAERLGGQSAATFISRDPETGQLRAGGEVLESSALAVEGEGETITQTVDPGNVNDIVKYTGSPDTLGPATNFVEVGGKVGIGTTTPARILELSDSLVPAFALRNTSQPLDNKFWEFSVFSNTLRGSVQNDANSAETFWMQVSRSGTDISSVVFPQGNVGIGTFTPIRALDISHPVVPAFALSNTGGSLDNKFWEYSVFQNTLRGSIRNDALNAELFWMEVQRNGLDVTSVSFPNGNVGVGTSSPGTKLEVAGQVKITGGAPGAGKVLTSDADGLASWATPTGGTGTATRVAFWDTTSSLSSNANLFWDNTNARLGVGTSSPSSRLHVDGNASDQVLLVTQNAPGIMNPTIENLPPIGVLGDATATSLAVVGVAGRAVSPNGIGVVGLHLAATGSEPAVLGITESTEGAAVSGEAEAATGETIGVEGTVQSTSGRAVVGEAQASTGVTTGVSGLVQSTTAGAAGVRGIATAESGATRGVVGTTNSTTSLATGVLGDALGNSGAVFGVRGRSSSPGGAGGLFQNLGGGPALATWDANNVETFRIEGDGSIQLIAPNTAVLIRLFGQDGLDQFHVFNNGDTFVKGSLGVGGNLNVTGSLSKGSGSFKIDHPLEPETKYLYHSFVESPDMKNVYDGVVALDARGEAVVELPEYFEALNSDFRYQLTCVGGFAPVYVVEEIRGNRFKIGGGRPGLKVSWQVTGIRQDAYANAHRIRVEEEKSPEERGTYLHPEAFGQPAEKGVAFARQRAQDKRGSLAAGGGSH
jgi:hypothetical protein